MCSLSLLDSEVINCRSQKVDNLKEMCKKYKLDWGLLKKHDDKKYDLGFFHTLFLTL